MNDINLISDSILVHPFYLIHHVLLVQFFCPSSILSTCPCCPNCPSSIHLVHPFPVLIIHHPSVNICWTIKPVHRYCPSLASLIPTMIAQPISPDTHLPLVSSAWHDKWLQCFFIGNDRLVIFSFIHLSYYSNIIPL